MAETAFERVLRTGEIRCGYAISPPTLVVDPNSGGISGADFDIWQEIGKEIGLDITWTEEVGWGNYIEGLRTGRYDAFCSQAWPNPPRIQNTTMAGPVLYNILKAYVRPDDTRFDGNLERINQSDIKIPAVDGDVSVAMVESRFPNATIYTLPQMATISDMIQSVVTKKADVLFLDETFYRAVIKDTDLRLKVVPDTDPVYVYGGYYSFLQGEYGLRDMVSIALRRIIDDGRMERIAKNYSEFYYVPQRGFTQ